MRGERDRRLAPPGENVVAPGLHGHQFGMTAMLRRQLRQVGEEQPPIRSSFSVMDSMSTSARVSSNTFIAIHSERDGGRKDTRTACVLPGSAPSDLES